MYSINARMFMSIPIAYELVSSALAGAQSLTIISLDAMPLKVGQKFILGQLGGASTEVELAEDVVLLANQPTTISVLPLPTGILAGATSIEARHPRLGNRIDQTVTIERFASVSMKKVKMEAGAVWQGDKQTIELVTGRWMNPGMTNYPWPSSDMEMQYQRDDVSIVEGVFRAASTVRSRLKMERYFGNKCMGEFLTDSRSRVIPGVVTDVCC
jgi:hypothetical protein